MNAPRLHHLTPPPRGLAPAMLAACLLLAGGCSGQGDEFFPAAPVPAAGNVALPMQGGVEGGVSLEEDDLMVGEVLSADGISIAFEAEGRGEPSLLFIHGWSCDSSYWAAQVAALQETHRTVVLDLAGHGKSGAGRADYTMELFAADVVAVAEHLNLQGVVLVGHSMGGAVMLEAAARMPERVAALVAVDTLQDVGHKLLPEIANSFMAALRADYPEAAAAFVRDNLFSPTTDTEIVEEIASDMASAPAEIAISAMENLLRHDETAALARIRVPVRCLNGEISPSRAEAGQRVTPDFDILILPGTGHFPMIEDPHGFNRLLQQVVRETVPEAS